MTTGSGAEAARAAFRAFLNMPAAQEQSCSAANLWLLRRFFDAKGAVLEVPDDSSSEKSPTALRFHTFDTAIKYLKAKNTSITSSYVSRRLEQYVVNLFFKDPPEPWKPLLDRISKEYYTAVGQEDSSSFQLPTPSCLVDHLNVRKSRLHLFYRSVVDSNLEV